MGERSSETIGASAREPGELSINSSDAGTETFDRDLALSMVANDQEALEEIEDAIDRIFAGTYGVCLETKKPINKNRLKAVPFTRFSVEGQNQFERGKIKERDLGAGSFATLADSTMGEEDCASLLFLAYSFSVLARYFRLWIVLVGVLILDQWTKTWVVNHAVELRRNPIVVVDGLDGPQALLEFTYVTNPGAAWSLFSDYPGALTLLAILALVCIFFFVNIWSFSDTRYSLYLVQFVEGFLVTWVIDYFANQQKLWTLSMYFCL